MVKAVANNELAEWKKLSTEQKSRLVRNLNWFHYRTTARSWNHEEVLTWELLHALQLLPRRAFLAPLLQACARANKSAAGIAALLTRSLAEVEIIEYPSLGLSGAKRNCRSDIGLSSPDGPRLWIEAKITPGTSKDLMAQLLLQQDALARLAPRTESQVIALIPNSCGEIDWPSIRWRDVAEVLSSGIDILTKTKCIAGDMDGYIDIAVELRQRILTHEKGIAV